jgi:hypothetical protein
MTDWATIASLATAGGTLILAIATFGSVRSSKRSAQVAEYAFRIGIRPLLLPSRLDDPVQKLAWGDEHWAKVEGGRAHVMIENDNIYLAMSVRNSGSGIAVIQGWHLGLHELTSDHPHAERDEFRPQQRDLFIPGGDIGFWQAAIRDQDDAEYADLIEIVKQRRTFGVEVLYTDHEGGQLSITYFVLRPPEEGDTWLASVVRHWNLDRPDPR